MKNNIASIIKTGAILLAIGFICTLLLALCNSLTEDRIANLEIQAQQEAMKKTLPEAVEFTEMTYEGDGVVAALFEGKADGKVVGYCVQAEPVGYGGAISMIVGVSTEGKVTGVDIVTMSETPGLGAKADDEDFTAQYTDKTKDVKVIKSGAPKDNEISAISGATITSKAVTAGVNAAIAAVESLN